MHALKLRCSRWLSCFFTHHHLSRKEVRKFRTRSLAIIPPPRPFDIHYIVYYAFIFTFISNMPLACDIMLSLEARPPMVVGSDSRPRRPIHRLRVHANLRNDDPRRPSNQNNASRLIIPGQGGIDPAANGQSSSSKLIIPGGSSGSTTQRDTGGGDTSPSPMRNFRPPPGFMDAEGPSDAEEAEAAAASPQDMLRRLQAQAGRWHELARLLPLLQAKGFDAMAVEEATGLERRMQNVWTSASSIYRSLDKSGEVSSRTMQYFDSPGGESLLHELRFLSLKQRIAAVEYIASNELDTAEAQRLARAIKEHERRVGEREGFSQTPADCLAYKFYRDALECRLTEEAKECAFKGLDLVESPEGRAKLESIVGERSSDGAEAKSMALLDVLRMRDDELGSRPVPMLGLLDETRADALRNAPKASSEGMFGIFTLTEEGTKYAWVPLPSWAALMVALRPVALRIPDCAKFPPLILKLGKQSEDAIQKAQGEGILVVDVKQIEERSPQEYYAVEGADGMIEIVEGSAVADDQSIVGIVMFLCRPPKKASDAASTSELLSV